LSILYVVYGLGGTTTALPLIPALFSGAIMLGAFFIATDPVSSAASPAGKVIYGAGIGLFTFIIREFSSYPEGMAFAVLLMNICVPLIDHVFTGPGSRLRTPS
jgi:electron transport complex protein RnfD